MMIAHAAIERLFSRTDRTYSCTMLASAVDAELPEGPESMDRDLRVERGQKFEVASGLWGREGLIQALK